MAETDVKVRQDDAQLPSATRPYRGDLFGWVQDQIALLNDGKLSDINAINIADELGDVGNDQYDKLESAIRIILHHFLKWDHQSERRSRSWVGSIVEQRRQVARVLKKNPSLKLHVAEAVLEAYEDAVTDAAVETGLPESTFPDNCPYPWDEILNRVVVLDDLQSPRQR